MWEVREGTGTVWIANVFHGLQDYQRLVRGDTCASRVSYLGFRVNLGLAKRMKKRGGSPGGLPPRGLLLILAPYASSISIFASTAFLRTLSMPFMQLVRRV